MVKRRQRSSAKPGSGYQPEERPCLELRHGFETSSAGGRVRCELCLPIGPL